jgi:hypothetical protein
MFEHRTMPVISHRRFVRRMIGSLGVAVGVALISLLVGMMGYHALEGLPWIDSFLNAAMILGGMGEISDLKTPGGKIFAGVYALYSGLWLVASIAILLAPVFHRVLHKFHMETK